MCCAVATVVEPAWPTEALLLLLHQELLDEVFGHGAGLAEVVIVKLVDHPHDVAERLLIGVPLEGGETTQSEK